MLKRPVILYYFLLYIPFTPIFCLFTLIPLDFLRVCAILQVQSNNEMSDVSNTYCSADLSSGVKY